MHAEAGERIVVRSYSRGDEAAILDLFARSFHQPRSIEQWRWKFQQNPFGRERISVALEGSRLVGHYAGYPVPFVLGGREFLGNQIGDTMTEPSIRHIGRGPTSVLGRTALHFYENFCEGKVGFNYGFNVANIQKFSLRFLRSDRVESVTYRRRDLEPDPMKRLTRVERYARGVQFQLLPRPTAELDELFARVAASYAFLVRRDARYVGWRYFDCPGTPYVVVAMRKWRRLMGWLVFRIRERTLTIGDLLIDPDHLELFDLALRHLTRVYPVVAVDGWFPPRPRWLDEMLQASGFETRAEPQDLSVMCVPFEVPDAVARMRESLYYTMGDSDLF